MRITLNVLTALIIIAGPASAAAEVPGVDTLGSAPAGVLLVSDQTDGVADPMYFDEYYKQAIDDIFGRPFTYKHLIHTRELTYEDLAPYHAVIWFTGLSGGTSAADGPAGNITLTKNEENAIIQYLSSTPSGGHRGVWLSGMYIAWNCVAEWSTQGQRYSTLFSQYIGLDYPSRNFTNPLEVDNAWLGGSGSSNPPLHGVPYSIFWAAGTYNYPDLLGTAGGAWTALTWQHPEGQSQGASIIANQGTSYYGGTWRIILAALPLESIGTQYSGIERMYMANDILSWFQVGYNIREESWGSIKARLD